MSVCGDCRKPVIKAMTPSGKRMKLDYAQVTEEGEAFIVNGDVAIQVSAVQRYEMRVQHRRMYPPHAPLCRPTKKPARSRSCRR